MSAIDERALLMMKHAPSANHFDLLHYRAGLVTNAMLAIDKRPLLLIGACDASAQILFMIGASHLPGVLLPVVNQVSCTQCSCCGIGYACDASAQIPFMTATASNCQVYC